MKKLLVVTEARFLKAPDGSVWTETIPDYSFWERYFSYFDQVIVISRIRDIQQVRASWKRVDGPRAKVIGFPYYVGPMEMIKQAGRIKEFTSSIGEDFDSVIMRVPGVISSLLWPRIKKTGKPIGLEVVGDPWESLSPGTVRSFSRPIARVLMTYGLKNQARQADAVSFVTKSTLQKRYPAKKYTQSYSSIDLPASFLASEPRVFHKTEEIRLVNVASMETLYKGHLTQLETIKLLIEQGFSCSLTLIGDGRCRGLFEEEAENLGISNKVTFLGALPGKDAIKHYLDASDLFIFPSLVEGLPRAVIEAMARGLPVIASNVGGIPELLEEKYMVRKGDAKGLAEKIVKIANDPEQMGIMSKRNLQTAREYVDTEIEQRRNAFYGHLASLTNKASGLL